jgi:hypothetical protein
MYPRFEYRLGKTVLYRLTLVHTDHILCNGGTKLMLRWGEAINSGGVP